MRRGSPGRAHQRGFTYFGVIIAVLLIGMTLAVVGVVSRTQMQREREAQLLWIGHQYRAALTQYFNRNGGQLPQSLNDLVLDTRNAGVPIRYIRKLYPDPMAHAAEWHLLTLPGGGIYGIASSSTATPLKVKGFSAADKAFEDATCYKAWQFVVSSRRLPIAIQLTANDC